MANHNKKMEDLFRNADSKLAERPSSRAWRNLDRKLDKHRNRSRMTILRNWSMAASLLLLVGVLYVFNNISQKNGNIVAMSETPQSMDDLANLNVKPIASKMASQELYQKRIDEGVKGKKLVVATFVSQQQTLDKETSDSLDI